MIASFVVSLIAFRVVPPMFPPDHPNANAVILLVTVAVSTVVWVTVTFLTSPEPRETLHAFYQRVRPGGPGWQTVSTELGYGREKIPGGALAWTNWIAGITAVYATLFGTGKLIFGDVGLAVVYFVIAVTAFLWIARSLRAERPTVTTAD
jgi:SSS family solute:Na+ symporter